MGGAALLKSPQSKTSPVLQCLGALGCIVFGLLFCRIWTIVHLCHHRETTNPDRGPREAYSRRHRRTAHALEAGVVGHPDSHRPHFYELDGSEHVYYIFPYPAGQKVLLIAVWQESRRRCKFFGPPISPVASKASKRS